MVFEKNSAFHEQFRQEDNHTEFDKIESKEATEDDRRTSRVIDQVIYDLNELEFDLRVASEQEVLSADEVQQLHRRVEDIRNELYSSLRMYGKNGPRR